MSREERELLLKILRKLALAVGAIEAELNPSSCAKTEGNEALDLVEEYRLFHCAPGCSVE